MSNQDVLLFKRPTEKTQVNSNQLLFPKKSPKTSPYVMQ